MSNDEMIRDGLTAALAGPARGREVADRFCGACAELLDVDGAALSIIYDGDISRSLGASSEMSRALDELQFTLGEGPCLDAVRVSAPVLVSDLDDPQLARWSGFANAAMDLGIRAVFALPVAVASIPIGALDLYRTHPGTLGEGSLTGSLIAAELAALPLLDMLGIDFEAAVNDEASSAWEQISALTRIEVYQAAGMLIMQLGVSPSEALVRLRGYAFAHNMTASEVAFEILDRRLRLPDDVTQSIPRQDGDIG